MYSQKYTKLSRISDYFISLMIFIVHLGYLGGKGANIFINSGVQAKVCDVCE